MKMSRLMMVFGASLFLGVVLGGVVHRKVRSNDLREQQERETCRIIGALLSLAETHYGYWGEFPAMKDLQCELVADMDESANSYLDAYGRAMKIEESADKLAICSAGQDGMFETSDDIVGNAIRGESSSRVNVKGPLFSFYADREWTLCEAKKLQNQNKGVKIVLRAVELGAARKGFWIENVADEILLKVPDGGVEYSIVYETSEGERKTIKNGRSPFETFKLVPLESGSRNPGGNIAYYFEVNMPKDCIVPISARIRVYAVGFDVLQSVSNAESLRRHMIGEPIELNIAF